jgi:hypothetical protein
MQPQNFIDKIIKQCLDEKRFDIIDTITNEHEVIFHTPFYQHIMKTTPYVEVYNYLATKGLKLRKVSEFDIIDKPQFFSVYKELLEKNPILALESFENIESEEKTWITEKSSLRQKLLFMKYKYDGPVVDYNHVNEMLKIIKSCEIMINAEHSEQIDKWEKEFLIFAKNHIWNMY